MRSSNGYTNAVKRCVSSSYQVQLVHYFRQLLHHGADLYRQLLQGDRVCRPALHLLQLCGDALHGPPD